MKRIENPGAVVSYEGKLWIVVGIGEGRTITMESLEESECARCGHQPRVSLLEHSPLFQDHVRPVETVAG